MEKVTLDVVDSTLSYSVRAFDKGINGWVLYQRLNLEQVRTKITELVEINIAGPIRFINIHYFSENKIYGTPI